MTFNIRKILCLAVLGALAAQPAVAQVPTVWFVDGDYTGTPENGESWDTPFNTIEEAIAQADENAGNPREQIWVKAGTYTPSNTTSGFTLKRDVEVYGGFAGDETPVENFIDNDPRGFDVNGHLVNETILNGELGSAGYSDNVSVIVTAPGDDIHFVLDGFTIEGAKDHGISAISAGGDGSSGTFRNLIVQDNEADDDPAGNFGGAGMYVDGFDSRPAIEKCHFRRNKFTLSISGGGGTGGGALFSNGAQPFVAYTKFEENETDAPNGGGGACADSGVALFRHCEFTGNSVTNTSGGGLSISNMPHGTPVVDCHFDSNEVICDGCFLTLGGGGVFDTTQATYIDCSFTNNSADGNGGGLAANRDKGITAINCLFAGNQAWFAGAVFILSQNQQGSGVFTNCTVANNASDGSFGTGGIFLNDDGAKLEITNCILWGNTRNGTGDATAQAASASNLPLVKTSCVDDGSPGAPIPFDASNIDTDPQFADPDGVDNIAGTVDDDFRLKPISLCIDAGDNTPLDAAFPADTLNADEDDDVTEPIPDLDLSYRIAFGDAITSGTTSCDGVIDMGAYEYSVACLLDEFGDMNDDSFKDGRDIQGFIDCLLSADPDCICGRGDFAATSSVAVTMDDVMGFVHCLLTGECSSDNCPPPAGGTRTAPADCNDNGVRDDVDIFLCNGDPDLCDCNGNGIPDSCDIANETSADANSNSTPDECEPDCNENGIPDDLDIANCASDPDCADCDENGVPDGCDPDCDNNDVPDACELSSATDCNSNGIYDACESDCDNDGVPDECELSGNDCNENGFPDDCEVNFPPPWNAPDCNNNDVPDACELSGNDDNDNGILDECESEQQSMMGGGGGSSESSAKSSSSSMLTESEAWDAYFAWCFETDFSSMNHTEIFSACLAKRLDLGLPAGQMLPE